MATENDKQIAHTPGPMYSVLPWHLGPHYRTDIMNRNGFVAECRPMMTPLAEANAEFIVRACNSHEELLAALKRLAARAEREMVDPIDVDEIQSAKAAIKKAEAR